MESRGREDGGEGDKGDGSRVAEASGAVKAPKEPAGEEGGVALAEGRPCQLPGAGED